MKSFIGCGCRSVANSGMAEGKKVTARGLLNHFPQDVKSDAAWLGHEFKIGETPIRATEAVPREILLKMVGENVEIEGTWNPGQQFKSPEPEDEEFGLQRPEFIEGINVVRGDGIEATSAKKVEN